MSDPNSIWPAALDLAGWIERHREALRPPVGNRCIVDGDFIVMAVGGPNRRSDFHCEDGPELFYQIEGEMTLRIREAGQVRDIAITAGQLYYLPPRVWHSPQRPAGSVGLVVERKRRPGELDGLAWFCEQCGEVLYESVFALRDIETDLPPIFAAFNARPEHRTCRRCGTVHTGP